MPHTPFGRMNQLVRLNNGNFKITRNAVILDGFQFDLGCERLGLEESLQHPVVADVT